MFFGDYTCLRCRGIIQLQVPFKTLEVMSQSQKLPVHPNVLHIPVSNDDPILHSSSVHHYTVFFCFECHLHIEQNKESMDSMAPMA